SGATHDRFALFFRLLPSPPTPPLFPYTTLFRSEPPVVTWPRTGRTSLTDIGTPWSGPIGSPSITATSAPRAAMKGEPIGPLHGRSEEHTSELQAPTNLLFPLLL